MSRGVGDGKGAGVAPRRERGDGARSGLRRNKGRVEAPEAAVTTRRRTELVRVSPVEEDGHVRRVARYSGDVHAAVAVEIRARDAARVLARTGLAHVLGRAERRVPRLRGQRRLPRDVLLPRQRRLPGLPRLLLLRPARRVLRPAVTYHF